MVRRHAERPRDIPPPIVALRSFEVFYAREFPKVVVLVVSECLNGTSLSGMFCAGEVGPVGVRSIIHGLTASLALFHDR